MGLQLALLLIEISVIFIAFSVHGSAVFYHGDFQPSVSNSAATDAVTFALPPRRLPQNPFPVHSVRPGQAPSTLPDRTFPPTVSPPSYGRKRHGELHAPSNKASHIWSPVDYSPTKDLQVFALAPSMRSFRGPAKKWLRGPASAPLISFHKHHHAKNKSRHFTSGPSYLIPSPSNRWRGPSISPFRSPFALAPSWSSHAPAASEISPSGHFNMPFLQPMISPMSSFYKKKKAPPPSMVMTLPPPPPKWRLCHGNMHGATDLHTTWRKLQASVGLNHSQVRIMGANEVSQQLEKSTVLINLVPWGVKFKDTTAFSIYRKFWKRQMSIKASLFGPYEVLYVRYPGLPPSPPLAHSGSSTTDDGPYAVGINSGQAIKPLGTFVLCCGVAWLFVLKCGASKQNPHAFISSPSKPSGAPKSRKYRSMLSSSSMSFDSSTMTYTGSAKTFSLNDMERATDCFDTSRILGEGGFGVVYRGILDDGREVAVKVLKRDDQHGGREFLAEIEMLGRLHHRNLVKLIGICTEDHTRCLVYELVHNGSVESHLHAKVAAIASMCVQPEVSHRPFMGEVVQALKLVCSEYDETKEIESKEVCHATSGFGSSHDNNVALSASDLLSMPLGPERQDSGSFRIYSTSGPLRTSRRRHFWQRLKSLSRGSMSEHGFSAKFFPGSR
ncbi:hypothetical protein Patl1_33517 [Pistacia atlantica]|uniref:Uncharacterized protein n=1 Tax=Pistacia atlantica TaxID=434234 RepID=A0ACC0ZS87_9ROSI|nr:hypothetical protein Patl1_33517 [Pistacia atlantica]